MNIYNVRQLLKQNVTIFDIELRVVYYARVSTEKDEQKVSIGHQREYYDDFINNVSKWKFAGSYVDEGISGISAQKREAFQKMLDDARSGKFDLILTKEISRFARNTLDSIQFTRELLLHGVAVWFQTDNINTLDEDSELRLSIMAAMAQDEIRKLSMRVRFGHARSIKNGVVLGNSMIYGWDKKNGALVINEPEAEMVRMIFRKYSTGLWTTPQLEKYLWEHGFRNRKGGRISRHVIGNIITNPKYKGYYVGGKVKIVDIFTKKQEFLPEDKWTMYKDDGTRVPAIIDEETWEMANRYYNTRSDILKNHKSSFKAENLFTGLIKCSNDGAAYWLKDKDSGSLHDTTWVCSHRIRNGACSCSSFPVRGSELKKILITVYGKLLSDQNDIVKRYMQLYKGLKEEKELSAERRIEKLEKEIKILKQKRDKILDFNLEGMISDEEFIKRNREFTQMIEKKEKELEEIRKTSLSPDNMQEKLEEMLTIARKYTGLTLDDIDRFIIGETIDEIRIKPTGDHQADIDIFLKSQGMSIIGHMLIETVPEPFIYERIPSSSIKKEVKCEYHVRVYL